MAAQYRMSGEVINKYTYKAAGVDIDRGAALVEAIKPLAAATRRPGTEARLGGFGAVFDLGEAGFRDPLLISATDGVGTKLMVAQAVGRHRGVGIDLVAMCVNDVLAQGAEPLFFLDYLATGRLDLEAARELVAGIAEGCREAGCALVGGETAELPGLYDEGGYDLAGFAVGAAEREALLPRDDIAEGDVVLGLSSSGLHANGFSLVRHIVADRVQDAPLLSQTGLARKGVRTLGVAEQPFEHRPGIVLHRQRRRGAAPGDRVRVGAAEAAAVARAGEVGTLQSELERRQRRLPPQLPGGQLVH